MTNGRVLISNRPRMVFMACINVHKVRYVWKILSKNDEISSNNNGINYFKAFEVFTCIGKVYKYIHIFIIFINRCSIFWHYAFQFK